MKTWLDYIYYEIGGQKTNFQLQNGWVTPTEERIFSKRKTYLELQGSTELFKQKHRSLLYNEVVLEFDGSIKDYLDLLVQLKKDKMKFYAFMTKSGRCKHIHTFWKGGIIKLSPREREQFRLKLILEYHCDRSLAADSHMIAIEYQPHWKTKEYKSLILAEPGINEVKEWL